MFLGINSFSSRVVCECLICSLPKCLHYYKKVRQTNRQEIFGTQQYLSIRGNVRHLQSLLALIFPNFFSCFIMNSRCVCVSLSEIELVVGAELISCVLFTYYTANEARR